MKLHRIQVTNLNSLYGEHSVDLDKDLQGASLFLIQGPTGSGKSTLMDAVSLALFGTTPRLGELTSDLVAGQIMSRGAGNAQALVEFSKWDSAASARVRYRATWTARRAREKPEGDIQLTKRSLERLSPGEPELLVSDGRIKVVKPVFDKVLEGFTTQDFQRSMLLAQGRFDAMLNAAPEERAAILERLTDTGQYVEIGLRASRIRGAWEKRLVQLRDKLAMWKTGSPQEIEAARALLANQDAAILAIEAERERLGIWSAWIERSVVLQASLNDAMTRQAELALAEEQAGPELLALAEHERCLKAFGLLDQRADLDRRERRAREESVEASSRLPTLQGRSDEAQGRERALLLSAERVAQALDALRLPVQAAQAARIDLDKALDEAMKAASSLANFQNQGLEARRVLEVAQQKLEQVRKRHALALTHREALQTDALLHEALGALGDKASAIVEAARNTGVEGDDLAGLRVKQDQEQRSLEADRLELEAGHRERLRPLLERVDLVQAALGLLIGGQNPTEALATRRQEIDQLVLRLAHIQTALQAVELRDRAALALQKRSTELLKTETEFEEKRIQLEESRVESERLERELESTRRVLEPLRRIAELGEHRAVLLDQAPCPLCGSLDHPFTSDPEQRARMAQIQAELARARAAQEEAEKAWKAATSSVQAANALWVRAGALTDKARTERSQAQAEYAQALEASNRALQLAGLTPEVSIPDIKALSDRVEQEKNSLKAHIEEIERARQEEQQASEALQTEQQSYQKAQADLGQRASALEASLASRKDREQRLSDALGRLSGLREALSQELLRFGIQASPAEEGLAQVRLRAQAWVEADKAEREARVEMDSRVKDLERALQARDTASRSVEDAEREKHARDKAFEQAGEQERGARARLQEVWQVATALDETGAATRPGFEQAPEDLLSSQEARQKELQARVEQARQAREAAGQGLSSAQARLHELERQQRDLSLELQTLADRIEETVAALGLQDTASLLRLRLTEDRLKGLKERERHLRESRLKADTEHDHALAELRRHDALRPSALGEEITLESLSADRARIEEERAKVASERDQARVNLGMMENNLKEHALAQKELDLASHKARIWLRLHELIGVNEGKNLRVFAQALNLGMLLRRANAHLLRLNERYRLQAVKNTETGLPTLDFLVEDTWRLGSTRSLKTLSGGESFLVSLALALGLADLRTSSMPVETLMLDEGFGTLDPRTLDVALAALRELRSSGRQIGIISHVAGLQESIDARILVEPLGEGHNRVRTEVGAPSGVV